MTNIFAEVVRMQKDRQAGVLVSVINKLDSGPAVVGDKLLVKADGKCTGTIGGGELEYIAIEESRELMKSQRHFLQSYNLSGNAEIEITEELNMICGGTITLFYEYLPVCPLVYICGAGHIGISLHYHLTDLNYRAILIDERPRLDRDLVDTNYLVTDDWVSTIKRETSLDDSYVVICTPSHDTDFAVLKAIYGTGCNPYYVGLVASPAKAQAMVTRLREELGLIPDLTSLYSPAGLDIGGKNPGEIAISIISEIQSVRFQKNNSPHMTEPW